MKIIVEVTQNISASNDIFFFLLCACCYDYSHEKDKKSMGYSCEPRTWLALHLSQEL